jgi:hypothetical protein
MKIPIKPMSVNVAWQGKRYKTKEYRQYEKDVALFLKPMEIPEGPLEVNYLFGVSNLGFDTGNAEKPFSDILSKYYGINDNRFHRIVMEKVKVPKGEEFTSFNILALGTGSSHSYVGMDSHIPPWMAKV